MLDRPEYAAYKNKIEFHIIHITNDPSEEIELTSVNPFVNDLASPIKTLLGAYGTQTSVNDFRLQKYIASINNEPLKGKHFTHLSLYKPKDSMDYTMSWVISRHVLNAMDERLYNYDKVTELVSYVRDSIPE